MTGNLGVFSLADLLQLLSNSTQTGDLKINHPTGEAHVYFDSGNIVHAEVNDQIGEEAIKLLFTQDSGDFAFYASQSSFETSTMRSIHKNTDMLLIQALGTAEEARIAAGSQKLPSLAIPFFVKADSLTETQSNTNLSLDDEEISILRLVDGQRTVQTIAIETGVDIAQVKTIVIRLVEAEFLKIQKPEIRVARLVIRLGEQSLPKGSVAIDRKILKSWSKQLNYPITEIKCKHPNGKILLFNAEPHEKLGPFMDVSQEVLIQHDLLADMALLVKPSRQLN